MAQAAAVPRRALRPPQFDRELPLLHDGGTLAARGQRRADPRRRHRTGGLPLHLQRRAGPAPRNRAGLPAPGRRDGLRNDREPPAADVPCGVRRRRQRRGARHGLRPGRRETHPPRNPGRAGVRTRRGPRTRTHGHADRRHGRPLHGRGLPAGAGGFGGPAHHDHQHHAGVVRQPLRQGADPAPRHRPPADGRKGGDDPCERARNRPPLRPGAPRHQVVALAAGPLRTVRHRPARRDAAHRRRGSGGPRERSGPRHPHVAPLGRLRRGVAPRKHRQNAWRRDGPADGALPRGAAIGRIHRPPARPPRTGMRERRTPAPGLCGAAGPLVARVRTG